MSWIVRLEDQRVLHDPEPPPPPPPPPPVKGKPPIVVAPPPPVPSLVRLLTDKEARIRRRAALAVGRTGLKDGVEPLAALFADEDPEVRQMAAFAIGLIGDVSGKDALVRALTDRSPLVKGTAAEALGLIGDPSAGPEIAQMATAMVVAGAFTNIPSDELDAARDSQAAAVRLACYALVRLKAYDALAAVALDPLGQPRTAWWPIAYAFQRMEDPRALPALLTLVRDSHPYTRAFAAKGLGAMGNAGVPLAGAALLPLVEGADKGVAVEAIRSLARLHDRRATATLIKVIGARPADPTLRLEAATALGAVGGERAFDTLIDLLGDPAPAIRAAALRSLSALDPESFVTVLSGLDDDPHWSVRAALASVLGSMPAEIGSGRLRRMLSDPDARVIPAVLETLAKQATPDAPAIMIEHLAAEDPVVRAAAANGLRTLKPANGVTALTDAYHRGEGDPTYVARAAALSAIAAYGAQAATPILTAALADKDWAVRVRAVALLKELDPATDAAARIRPAPSRLPELYTTPHIINPQVSTQAFIDTAHGTIQIELAVLDAPETVETFVRLARDGFFDKNVIHRVVPDFVVQAGDPRGDGEGGPGFTIRDELNERPYLRGTVGMALDWADTGGSQFFITLSPQPHLDARYTVFGRVVAGMDVVDQIQQWDEIVGVRIWDGTAAGAAR